MAVARRHEDTGHNLDTDGCPWAFVLSRFGQSLLRYLGTRTWEGQRHRSLLLERRMLRDEHDADAELLWEAVSLYEAHEDGAYAQAERRRVA